ncbi:MAG: DinB family protein [Acidobacteriota bacterium]
MSLFENMRNAAGRTPDIGVPPRRDTALAETFLRTPDFSSKMQAQRADFASLALGRLIHHRGQRSAYLRRMGGKVPGIYGPGGDSA